MKSQNSSIASFLPPIMNIGYGANENKTCCKVNLGIAQSDPTNCDDECNISGACDLRVAVCCAVFSTVETTCPDKVVQDVVLNDTTNNPDAGDDEHAFYNIGTVDKTLGHSFEWTCNDDNDNKLYSDTIDHEVSNKSARAFCALDNLLCKDVVALLREACDEGKWIIVGLGGGFGLNSVSGGTGILATDNNNTVVQFTGTELNRPWCYLDAGDPILTQALVDSLTDTAV